MKEKSNRASFASFPSTHWSMVNQAGASDESRQEALEKLASLYWKPIYAYLRLRWKNPHGQASDLTQQFFIAILEGRYISVADKQRGRFRSFLRKCLDNFTLEDLRHDRAQKRGGGAKMFSIDVSEDPDRFLISRQEDSPEEILDRHWRKAVLDEALKRLEERYEKEGRIIYFRIFQEFDLHTSGEEKPSHQQLAEKHGIEKSDVDNHLRHARKSVLAVVKEILADSVMGEADLEREERDFMAKSPW